MSDVSRTTLTTARPIMPTEPKGFFHGLFTDHPVAKLMALGLSALLIILIHRELVLKLVDEEFPVTSTPIAGENHLLVTTEGRKCHLDFPTDRVRVEVEGFSRQSTDLPRPLVVVATIPRERLEGLGLEDQVREITLEPGDFSIAGFDKLEIKTKEDLVVTVRTLLTKRVRTEVEVEGSRQGATVTTTVSPSEIELIGPANRINELGEAVRWTGLRIPDEAAIGTPAVVVLDELPEGVRAKDLAISGDSRVTVTFTLSPSEDLATVEIRGVAMVLIGPYPNPYEFILKPPHDKGEDAVELAGPRDVIEALKKDEAELAKIARSLRLLVDVESRIAAQRAEIEKAEEGIDLYAPMRLDIPADVLERHPGLKIAGALRETHLRVRKRPPPK